MNEAANALKPLPIFVGLKTSQLQSLFQLCTREDYAPGQVLCEYGAPSQRLFVLAKGRLEVLAEDGGRLALIEPVNAVGEVGFVTGKPRSATVRAEEPSSALVLEAADFEKLVGQDLELRASIYRNVIRWLAEKLCDANDMIVRYRRIYEPLPGQHAPAAPAAPVPPAAPATGRTGETFVVGTEFDDKEEANEVVGLFYKLTDQQPSAAQLAEDRQTYAVLRRQGRSREDIVYAVKWTTRYRPRAKRFNIVRLSIKDAFESRWSV
jgi:signal-transduction protein with cAMP-binding, CBS, and nucleotidyltransferase domain